MDFSSFLEANLNSSVFHLVTQLCSNIVTQQSSCVLTSKEQDKCVKCARSLMYGMLLGKTHLKDVNKLIEEISGMDPISCLISTRFILNSKGNTRQALELNDAIDQAIQSENHLTIKPILQFLVALTNSGLSISENLFSPLMSPRLMEEVGISKSGSGIRPYRIFSPDTFNPPAWMSIKNSISRFGGYSSDFPFNKSPGEDLPVLGNFWSPSAESRSNSEFRLPPYQLRTVNLLTEPKELFLPLFQCNSQQVDEGYVTPVTDLALVDNPDFSEESEDPTKFWSEALHVKLPQVYSWETLGVMVSEPEKPFISAAPPEALHHLSLLANFYQDMVPQNSSVVTQPYSVSRGVFIRDALYLLVGVESSNFSYLEEEDCFVVRSGLCLEGYTVKTTELLCNDFLFCGIHFQRLEKFSDPQRSQVDSGLVVQALKESIWRWTRFYYGLVLVLSNNLSTQISSVLLFELIEKVRILKEQVECLAQLSHVCGPQQCAEPLPSGIALLAHVYREASMSSPQLSHLLYSVLRSCCMVYLRCLEQWIFHGHCSNEEYDEFFVHSDGNFSCQRNRLYWTHGFVLNRKFVPDFLKGLENAIFDCGRAINLLLLCTPNHPLCFLLKNKHPILRCCLYKTDLEMVQNECAEFELDALEKCGEEFKVANLFEEERKRETRLQCLILKVQEEEAVARASLKAQQLKQLAERKRQQHADLKAQMEAAEQRKAEEHKRLQLEDKLYLEECKKAEEILNKKEEAERQRLMAYYRSLNEITEKQEERAEWQIKRLKLAEKRQKLILMAETKDYEEYIGLDAANDYTGLNGKFATTTNSISGLHSGSSFAKPAYLNAENSVTVSSDKSFERCEEGLAKPCDVSTSACKRTSSCNNTNAEPGNESSAFCSKDVLHHSNHPLMTSREERQNASLETGSIFENVSSRADDMDPDWKKNQRRVLGSDINISCQSSTVAEQSTTVVKKETQLTGAQILKLCEDGADNVDPVWKRNRRRVLGTDINYQSSTEDKQIAIPIKNESELMKVQIWKSGQNGVDNEEPDWKKNRRRVLGSEMDISPQSTTQKNEQITSDLKKEEQTVEAHCLQAKPCEVTDIEPDWKRNRRRVLQTEFNILNGESLSACTTPLLSGRSADRSQMSDLERNRRKILGEEFDILTGECKVENVTPSLVLPSKQDCKYECEGSVQSPKLPSKSDCDMLLLGCETQKNEHLCDQPDVLQNPNEKSGLIEPSHSHLRPHNLALTSSSSNGSKSSIYSSVVTPLSCSDLPVFASPFGGTDYLPNELFLTSPVKSANDSFREASSRIEGFPIMIDILDSLPQKLGSNKNDDQNCEASKSNAIPLEPSKSSPNTAWLESSLQKCLLIPLHVQHRFVSAALLQYFLVDLKLLSHLRSLRSYYFMLDGEFGHHLTVKLFTEMYQVTTPAGLLNVVTLTNMLRGALASSQGAVDPNRSQLSLCVTNVPHHFSYYSPNVLDCLHLLYSVHWPLNLLLTEEAIKKYNEVFLFLVRLRRVAWLLQEDFIALKKTAHSCLREENGDLLNSPQYHQVQMIRHTMSQFVQAALNYVSSSVLHASWADFEESLKQAKTIDHIYVAHISYVKQLIKRCLLNNNSKRVEAVLCKVLASILQFHSQLRVRQWQLPNKNSTSHLEHPNFKFLLSCFKHFKVCRLLSYLERLIAPPNQQKHLADLMLLLNINGFYQTSDYLQYAESSAT